MASAKSRKARSILILALALVSRNLMPCSRAMTSPFSLLTTRFSSISHLLPKIIFSTSSLACYAKRQEDIQINQNYHHHSKNDCSWTKKTHLIDVAQPFGNIIKAFRVGDIVDEHYSHCTTVIAGGDCVEPFLAGSVPEHQQTNKSPN